MEAGWVWDVNLRLPAHSHFLARILRKGRRDAARSWTGDGQARRHTQFLPLNGPRGTYSQRWMSRALQSFMSTTPKM